MNVLQKWMAAATAEEKKRLAMHAKTTLGALRQAAGGYKTEGKLALTSEFAARIATATAILHRKGLPRIDLGMLSPTCAACKYLKECK